MEEVWRPIPDYEGYYEASNMGRIRSVDRYVKNYWGSTTFLKSRIMVCYIAKTGYMQVKLSKNGVEKKPLVHRLVALTFLPNPLQLPQVNHIDGDKTNNNVTNLEWCTGSDNQLHSRRILNRVCGMKRKPVICLENGKIYESVSHAARELKLYPKNIAKVCKGKYGKTGGMHFKYVE